MQDLKIEAVKLNLQLSSPASAIQNNAVLRTISAEELDSIHAMTVIREAIADLTACTSIADLHELFNEWNEIRIKILKGTNCGNERVFPGDVLDASRKDATLLIARKFAVETKDDKKRFKPTKDKKSPGKVELSKTDGKAPAPTGVDSNSGLKG